MVNDESTMKIDMEIRSDKLKEDDLPDAELHVVYRRVKYDTLLFIEDKFVAEPFKALIREARDGMGD